jgi:hypothetical protein
MIIYRLIRGWLFTALTGLFLCSSASAGWKEKVLYSFQGIPDGAAPLGRVVFDRTGNLYSATSEGGSESCMSANQCGTVIQLSPPARKGDPWTETVLYVFKGNTENDGATSAGGLAIDSAGNLYGTTAYGGTGNCTLLGTTLGCGTVFQLSPPKQKGGAWTEKVLYSFPDAKKGYFPWGNLAFDSAGNLYGATQFGGGKGTTCNAYFGGNCGAVFELSPPTRKGGAWAEKTLHSFAGGSDGANPNGGLVFDDKGAIYGTTYAGGGQCGAMGCGTAFELKPPTRKDGVWTENVLHRFNPSTGEAYPAAGMTFDGQGRLYGTTLGTVFRLTSPPRKSGHWKETILYTFNQDAYDPEAALIFDQSGNLYGTTTYGNTYSGTVFRLKHPMRRGGVWTFRILHGFLGTGDGAQPAADLIFDKHGNLFSTTTKGGAGSCSFYGCGTVFRVSP